MSALENELTSDFNTFEHFGREWSVPNKKHLSHIKAMRDAAQLGFGGVNLALAEVFLSPEFKANQQRPDQWAALLEIDPDEKALDEFTEKLADALGTGDSGNSSPSSASS